MGRGSPAVTLEYRAASPEKRAGPHSSTPITELTHRSIRASSKPLSSYLLSSHRVNPHPKGNPK